MLIVSLMALAGLYHILYPYDMLIIVIIIDMTGLQPILYAVSLMTLDRITTHPICCFIGMAYFSRCVSHMHILFRMSLWLGNFTLSSLLHLSKWYSAHANVKNPQKVIFFQTTWYIEIVKPVHYLKKGQTSHVCCVLIFFSFVFKQTMPLVNIITSDGLPAEIILTIFIHNRLFCEQTGAKNRHSVALKMYTSIPVTWG